MCHPVEYSGDAVLLEISFSTYRNVPLAIDIRFGSNRWSEIEFRAGWTRSNPFNSRKMVEQVKCRNHYWVTFVTQVNDVTWFYFVNHMIFILWSITWESHWAPDFPPVQDSSVIRIRFCSKNSSIFQPLFSASRDKLWHFIGPFGTINSYWYSG